VVSLSSRSSVLTIRSNLPTGQGLVGYKRAFTSFSGSSDTWHPHFTHNPGGHFPIIVKGFFPAGSYHSHFLQWSSNSSLIHAGDRFGYPASFQSFQWITKPVILSIQLGILAPHAKVIPVWFVVGVMAVVATIGAIHDFATPTKFQVVRVDHILTDPAWF